MQRRTGVPATSIRRTVDNALTSHAVLVGHLILTGPAAAAILLVPFFALRMFGPFNLVYYFAAGIVLGWQWYLLALPLWKKWLTEKSACPEEIDSLVVRAGLAWPVDSPIGPLALHTTVAAACGIHFGPWLLSRWYVWIVPLSGMSSRTTFGDDYLRHFEVASIVPALVVGYLLSRRFERLATTAWVLPAIVLAYKLLAFSEPQASVLAPHTLSRFGYFFDIQRTMAKNIPGFSGAEHIHRLMEQLTVVAPFYSGLAYSAGAALASHELLKALWQFPPAAATDMTQTETPPEAYVADEKQVRKLD